MCIFCKSHLPKLFILSPTFLPCLPLSLVNRSSSVQSIPSTTKPSLFTLPVQHSLSLPPCHLALSFQFFPQSKHCHFRQPFISHFHHMTKTLFSIFNPTNFISNFCLTSVMFTCLSAICRKGSPFLSLQTNL